MTLFWITAAALTLLCVVTVARPVWRQMRSRSSGFGEFEHDVMVYRHQLEELAAEIERGAISRTDGAQARAEIARRLIAAEDKAAREADVSQREQTFGTIVLASVLLVFVPAMTFILYLGFGSPDYPAQPLQARLAQQQELREAANQSEQEMLDLVARAEAHLKDNPDDGQGWAVLAPVYFRIGQPTLAAEAYTKAIALVGETPERLSGLGEALFVRGTGKIGPDALAAFNRAVALDVNEPRARFYLNLATAQEGDIDGARTGWAAMANELGADTEWGAAAAEGVRRIEANELASIPGIPSELLPEPPLVSPGLASPGAPGMPQLDDETIAEVEAMSADDRMAMIRGMVGQLAERLAANPDDAEGWMRLIQAHVVLNDQNAARDALNRALDSFVDRPDIRGQIEAFANGAGVSQAQPN